ncbi:MAG TPA: GIDE domain-containing protein [Steroidobacteraceae bacterium]|jgi:hypothetical protein
MLDGIRLCWALAASCSVTAAYAIYRLFGSLNRDRFVTDTPLVRIRSAAQGYSRIEGHACRAGPELLLAPLSARPCVWWDYHVSIKQTDSRGNSKWSRLESATSVTPFTLEDLDGKCLVGPVGAEVTPTDTDTWYGDTPRPVAGPPQHLWIGSLDHTYRYTECLIAPGTRLSVLGELRSHAEDSGVDGEARSLLASWKSNQPQLLEHFDADHDGRIESQEWEAARAAARAAAAAAIANSRIERSNMFARPTHGQPFIIAPLDGTQLAHRERRHAWLFLAAAVLFVGLTVWSLHRLRQLSEVTYPAAQLLAD